MRRREALLIVTFISVAMPLSSFVLGWWTAAALYLYGVFSFPEQLIWAGAGVGLGAGILLVIVRRRRWVAEFYSYPAWLLVPVYLFWSLLATALLMGLPLAILAVGALAGCYIGRQAAHAAAGQTSIRRQACRVSIFTASVTGAVSLGMGLLALQDRHTLMVLLRLFGLGTLGTTAGGRGFVVAVAVPVLGVTQYLLTRGAALWAHGVERPATPT